MLTNNRGLYVAFVDFTKAFDCVAKYILWYKFLKVGKMDVK